MRILMYLLQKEFLQIFRNKSILPVIFVMPLVQLIILPLAANYEMKNINISIVDADRSVASQRLIGKITASNYFILSGYFVNYKDALKQVELDKSDVILEIPAGFERDINRENKTTVSVSANGIGGQVSGIAGAYINQIIREYNNELRAPLISSRMLMQPTIEITTANWFNPALNYRYFMVPGIMAIMVTMVGFFLSSLNIVKEKETGTIEQINVTPIKKYHFILAKLIPFWVLGLMVLTVGVGVAYFVYGIVPIGNPFIVYCFAALYLIALLGFGLFASTFADTQQQAMFIAYFFMTTSILMGGLFSSIDNMPDWAQVIAMLNPITYFIDVMRMVALKGSTFADLYSHFARMLGFAVFFNALAIWNYKKVN